MMIMITMMTTTMIVLMITMVTMMMMTKVMTTLTVRMAGWRTGCLPGWLAGSGGLGLAGWLAGWQAGRLAASPVCLIPRPSRVRWGYGWVRATCSFLGVVWKLSAAGYEVISFSAGCLVVV